MKMTLYFIRHGETDNNVKHRFIGRTDMPLNERGIEQAQCVGRAMSGIRLDALYTSPYQRAVMTAEQICSGRDLQMVKDPGLCEIDCGDWDGLGREEIEERWPGMIELWQHQPDKLEMPNGETFQQVQDRAFRTFLNIVEKERGKAVAVTSHMLTIQLILARMLNIPIRDVWKMRRLDNASITELAIYDGGEFEIIRWGDDRHLPDHLKNTFVKIAGFIEKSYTETYHTSNLVGRHKYLNR